MSRGLDHIVHAVRDLDAAAQAYRDLGFTVGARNRHPWGTHNHLVQFPGFFIEILAVVEPEQLGEDGFSVLFGGYNRHFLEHYEGFSMLILESQDASADERDFVRAQLAASSTMRFEREGKRPDGSPVTVAFSLAFARDPKAPDIGLAVCEQHHPENFWNRDFQSHTNGASGPLGAVIAAAEPAKHVGVMEALAGARATSASNAEFMLETPRGKITLMTPAMFQEQYGVEAPDVTRGARLAALRLANRKTGAPNAVSRLMGATLVLEGVSGD